MKSERKRLEDKLDRLVSKYVRERDNWTCYTCGKPGNQAGHYIPRARRSVRWDLRNVHCQCMYCNCTLEGNRPKYRARLLDEYGHQVVAELERLMYETAHFTLDDLRAKIHYMQEKLKEVY